MTNLDFGPHRSTRDYRFTTTDLNDPAIKDLKAMVANHNKYIRELVRKQNHVFQHLTLDRVRLMPRGPRDTANVGRRFWAYLPMWTGLATHYDVYVSSDSTANYILSEEINTGLTPGQQQRVAKLNREIWDINYKGRCQKRERKNDAGN